MDLPPSQFARFSDIEGEILCTVPVRDEVNVILIGRSGVFLVDGITNQIPSCINDRLTRHHIIRFDVEGRAVRPRYFLRSTVVEESNRNSIRGVCLVENGQVDASVTGLEPRTAGESATRCDTERSEDRSSGGHSSKVKAHT